MWGIVVNGEYYERHIISYCLDYTLSKTLYTIIIHVPSKWIAKEVDFKCMKLWVSFGLSCALFNSNSVNFSLVHALRRFWFFLPLG